MHDPGAQQPRQIDVFDWESILARVENRGNRRKTLKSGWDRLKLSPHTIAEVGGTNVEYSANQTSQGKQHRATRMVAHPDINPAQRDLTSVIKWEPVFSLVQVVSHIL